MINARPKGSVIIWAWALSIIFHALLLALFAVVGFSKSTHAPYAAAVPKITVSQIKQLNQTPVISPKPKIKNTSSPVKIPLALQQLTIINDTENKTSPTHTTAQGISHLASTAQSLNSNISGRHSYLSTHTADLRKICYVVDCSASMFGRLTSVQQQLKDSINSLRADQYFYIIFFRQGRKLHEFGNGKLIRATDKAKTKASRFIETAQLGGTTDAKFAIKRAINIKDSAGKPPQVIFFLTDGFDLKNETEADLPGQLQKFRKQLAPNTIINTIAFQPAPADRQILESIAEKNGGMFINIE
jgi:hypothetical protein